MSLFTPGRRYQPAFRPFKREKFSKRILARIERSVKGPLFGCRMCGNCLLQETAFICPMECPKGMRNGPCGGSSANGCYVDPSRPCIWYKIYERSFRLGREEHLMEVLPPLDWSRTGKETWAEVFSNIKRAGFFKFVQLFFPGNKKAKILTKERVFASIRQPQWWQGDCDYHNKTYDQPVSNLEKELRSGKFVVTSEITPPLGTATGKLVRDIGMMQGKVTALNFTDNASANPRMSSLASCKISAEQGLEPVMQIAARDMNRSGLQSQVIGASALGIRNILCVSGDSPLIGPEPTGNMNVLDLDAIQMLWILRRMRDEGLYLDGRRMKYPPQFFLGAAASPYASDVKYQALREHKKVNAGAQFLQTNLIFDINGLDKWLEELYKRDVLDKVFILAGIAPLKNIKIANYLNNNIPGVTVPDKYIKRFYKYDESSSESIGKDIAAELINSLKQKQGINGVHIMSVGWESVVPGLIEECML